MTSRGLKNDSFDILLLILLLLLIRIISSIRSTIPLPVPTSSSLSHFVDDWSAAVWRAIDCVSYLQQHQKATRSCSLNSKSLTCIHK